MHKPAGTSVRIVIGSAAVLATFILPLSAWAAPTTELVSTSSAEEESLRQSGLVTAIFGEPIALSEDGRYVAFTSTAPNLVAHDTNATCDVFVRDRLLGLTERVSVSDSGGQGNRSSCLGLALSPDGRFIAFASRASNLTPRDTNEAVDVFARDRKLDLTRRVSRRFDGRQIDAGGTDPAISANGRRVAFTSTGHVVRHDTATEDVYVHNRKRGWTRRVSVTTAGLPGNDQSFDPSISADGHVVAFASRATNLAHPDLNFDGSDVFVHVLADRRTRRVSVDSDGHQLLDCSSGGTYNPYLDSDGSRVVFTESDGGCLLSHVMFRDRVARTTEQLDQGMGSVPPDGWAGAGGITSDGTEVVFASNSTNLVPGDTNDTNGDPFDFISGTDVFVVDVASGVISRVSVSEAGAQIAGSSGYSAMSSDGAFAAFVSGAAGVVAGDTNGKRDVFVRGPL
jgi:Tol biopolymer transport system component